MLDVKVGQFWQEKSGQRRRARVILSLVGSQTAMLHPVSGGKNNITKSWSEIAEKWVLVDPDTPARRRIVLELAPDTTATECGSCDKLENYHCGAFGHFARFNRLAECIAAEVAE